MLIAAPLAMTVALPISVADLPAHVLHSLDDGRDVGVLSPVAPGDWVVKQYTGVSRVWSSVTPVMLPGHDDHDSCKAEGLLRKALVQAGLQGEVVASAEL